MSFKVPKFNLSQLPTNASIVIVGIRMSGKTTLIKDIVTQLDINKGIIFSQTEHICPAYTDLGEVQVIEDAKSTQSEQVVEKFIKRQILSVKQYGKTKQNNHFIISDYRNQEHPMISSTWYHTNLLRIYKENDPYQTHNYGHSISTDYIFIFKQSYRFFCYNTFFENKITYDWYCDIMEQLQFYDCLVLKNFRVDPIESCIFWYRVNTNQLQTRLNEKQILKIQKVVADWIDLPKTKDGRVGIALRSGIKMEK